MQQDYLDYMAGKIDLNELISRNMGFFVKIVMDRTGGVFNEDYLQSLLLLFIEHLEKYDQTKGALSTYVYSTSALQLNRDIWSDSMIRKPVWLYEKNVDRKKITVISDTIKIDSNKSGDDMLLIDLFSSTDSFEDSVLEDICREDLFSKLDELRRTVLEKHLDGYTCKQIGELMGKGGKNIHKLLTEAKNKIKNHSRRYVCG